MMSNKITSLKLYHQGKVRDTYIVDDSHFLMITSDRISAFDVIMNELIPGKGEILSSISNFWFNKTSPIIKNHLTEIDPESVVSSEEKRFVSGRSVVVKRLKPIPMEAIVRGYIIGSGWKDYQSTGTVCEIPLPSGLKLAQKLDQPIFTPSTKADVGDHDENISFEIMVNKIGKELSNQIKDVSLELYATALKYAESKNIIIADTKFEFGLDEESNLVLMDEILTPDSSRFWDKSNYSVGHSPDSFDKQYLRDWLEGSLWDKTPPPPSLPDDVIQQTIKKYQHVRELLLAKYDN
jgi:phosphoribosylaminoimidazole-succinocarboxamide synthase